MIKDIEKIYLDNLKRQLNKYLLKSRRFCDKYCHPDGLTDILIFINEYRNVPESILYSSKLSYDFDYFIFTKGTKALHAIKTLLEDKEYNFNEDIMILMRSMFEGHLASRYFREVIDNVQEKERVIKEFIKSPIGLITDYYFQNKNIVNDKTGAVIAEVKGPSKLVMGKDKRYYHLFYPFLCQFTHSNFGTLKCYFDGVYFEYNKKNFNLESLLFTIFVFTKLVEGIVTVWGENFDSPEEEKSYYDMVYDSLELQYEVFDYLIEKYSVSSPERLDWILQLYLYEGNPEGKNKKMIDMLTKMKESIYEEIGSLKKDRKSKNGKFIRQYPSY